MRNVLSAAVSLLATAAAMGLARPARAETPSLIVSSFMSAVHVATDANAMALPRVVPVAAVAAKPAANEVAVATVSPAAWLSAPKAATPAKPAVVPATFASWASAKSAPPLAAPPAAPALLTGPAAATSRAALRPPSVSKPATKSWPPAHLVRKNPNPSDARGAAYVVAAPLPQATVGPK